MAAGKAGPPLELGTKEEPPIIADVCMSSMMSVMLVAQLPTW